MHTGMSDLFYERALYCAFLVKLKECKWYQFGRKRVIKDILQFLYPLMAGEVRMNTPKSWFMLAERHVDGRWSLRGWNSTYRCYRVNAGQCKWMRGSCNCSRNYQSPSMQLMTASQHFTLYFKLPVANSYTVVQGCDKSSFNYPPSLSRTLWWGQRQFHFSQEGAVAEYDPQGVGGIITRVNSRTYNDSVGGKRRAKNLSVRWCKRIIK